MRMKLRFLPCLLLTPLLVPVLGVVATGASAEQVTFELRIEGGRVPPNMRLIRVKQGDTVNLRWSSDRPAALHLHGYDVETKVEPGTVAEMSFTARATGRFSVEQHKPKAGGGHTHEAPIVRIEVYPR
jgi:hypothetical protein